MSMSIPPLGDPADSMRAFAELASISLAESDTIAVLQRIAELARAAVPPAVEVSVTVITAKGPSTVVHTGPISMDLDESQYESGHGPCLDAAAQQQTFIVADTATETRWPAFTTRAREHGIGCSIAVGIPVHEEVSLALNVYGRDAHALTADHATVLAAFAGYAAVALANSRLYEAAAALARQLREAMDSRAVIEQAKGVVIAQRGVGADEAFKILSRASQTSNRKLRDVAHDLVNAAAGIPRP
jgi:GAF domain-containing protein